MRNAPATPSVAPQAQASWKGAAVASRSGAPAFARALAAAQQGSGGAGTGSTASMVSVEPGDTLIHLVKAHHRQAGLPITESAALRQALQVARDNGISDADVIHPGQALDFSSLGLPPLVRSAGVAAHGTPALPTAVAWSPARSASPTPLTQVRPLAATAPAQSGPVGPQPILERTLERAVQKGFIPAHDAAAVRQRIGQLAQDHGFSPDDFALLTLMESDGMNPQASNGRCHGIIQFCDGEGRGAASVGYAQSPRAILGLDVLKQLELVDTYFRDVGPRSLGPISGADDLYLTVLQPAARVEKRRDVPLRIAGPQAAYLHVGHNRSAGITRDSIAAGLHTNAGLRLGVDTRALLAAAGAAARGQEVAAWPVGGVFTR